MRTQLRQIVEDNTTTKGKFFDYTIQALILISLISFSLETLPDNSTEMMAFLHFIEVFCVILFSIEYLLRIYVAERPFQYIFSFYGIIDFLAIFPFYLQGVVDLRVIRAFRVLRIFRALKLVRYNRALRRFNIAAGLVREEVVLFLIVAGIMIYLSAAGIYFFEHGQQDGKFTSIFDSLWWAIVTLTTVGYGDVFPITIGGKVFTSLILIVGVGIVTIPAGLVATALSRAREIEAEENKESGFPETA
jgi:voltage-gated potassium channel